MAGRAGEGTQRSTQSFASHPSKCCQGAAAFLQPREYSKTTIHSNTMKPRRIIWGREASKKGTGEMREKMSKNKV